MKKLFEIIGKLFSMLFGRSAPKYLVNEKTKEIHDLKKLHVNCHVERMAEKNKRYIYSKEKDKLFLSKEYNGCRWCMSNVDTDKQK